MPQNDTRERPVPLSPAPGATPGPDSRTLDRIRKVTRRGAIVLLLGYALVLVLLTLTPSSDENPVRQSWIPLQSTWPTLVNLAGVLRHPEYLEFLDTGGLVQIVGNLLLFIPFGWVVPRVFPQLKPTLRLIGIAALISLAIELVQLFVVAGRMASIDDVILNAASSWIGLRTTDAFWRAVANHL